jgi:hypothetical protein
MFESAGDEMLQLAVTRGKQRGGLAHEQVKEGVVGGRDCSTEARLLRDPDVLGSEVPRLGEQVVG